MPAATRLAYLALAVVTSRSKMLRLPSDCPMTLQPTQMASRLQEVSIKKQPSGTINEKFGGGRLRTLRGTKTRPLKSAISATRTQPREHSGGLALLLEHFTAGHRASKGETSRVPSVRPSGGLLCIRARSVVVTLIYRQLALP